MAGCPLNSRDPSIDSHTYVLSVIRDTTLCHSNQNVFKGGDGEESSQKERNNTNKQNWSNRYLGTEPHLLSHRQVFVATALAVGATPSKM